MKKIILIMILALGSTSFAGETQTTTREATSSEKKALEEILKSTDISKEEESEINELSSIAIDSMKVKGYENFDYSEASVEKLSRSIDEAYPFSDKVIQTLPSIWGAYLGNALVKNFKGKWAKMGDGSYGVILPSGYTLFPINRAYKHAAKGPEDSIFALYKSVQQINNTLSKP